MERPQSAQLWRFVSAGEMLSPPVVSDGFVFVGDETGTVYAVDASSGAADWQAELGSAVSVAPAVTDRTVCVATDEGSVYGIDAKSGVIDWAEAYGTDIEVAPAATDGTVYVGAGDHLYALDAATGEALWDRWLATGRERYQRRTWGTVIRRRVTATPAVDFTGLYFGGTPGRLYAMTTGGDKRWDLELNGAVRATVSVDEGTVYTGDDSGAVYAVDAQTGESVWAVGTHEAVTAGPTVANETVYVGDAEGRLYAIDAASGTTHWQHPVGGRLETTPVWNDGEVVIGSAEGIVYGLDPEEGSRNWTISLGEGVGAPTVHDTVAYVDNEAGNLFAINLDADIPVGARGQAGALGEEVAGDEETITEEQVRADIERELEESDVSIAGGSASQTRRLELNLSAAEEIDREQIPDSVETRTDAESVDNAVSQLSNLQSDEVDTASGEGVDDQTDALRALKERQEDEE